MDRLLQKLHLSSEDERPAVEPPSGGAAPAVSSQSQAQRPAQTTGSADDAGETPRFPPIELPVPPIELGTSSNVPSLVLRPVDKYVDGIRPVLTPMLIHEIEVFQSATLDSIERHLLDAWHGIFEGNLHILSRKPRAGVSSRNTTSTRSAADGVDDVAPEQDEEGDVPEYGELGEPFAEIIEDLSDVLSSDYDPMAHASPEARQAVLHAEAVRQADLAARERGNTASSILGVALDRITAFAESSQGQLGFGLTPDEERLLEDAAKQRLRKEATRRNKMDGDMHDLGAWVSRLVLSNESDGRADPVAVAGRLTPALKAHVGALLAHAHAPLAEALTALALGHLKRWLRGNTEAREVRELTEGMLDNELDNFRESVAEFAGKMFSGGHHHGVHRLLGLRKHEGEDRAAYTEKEQQLAQHNAIADAAPPASAPSTTKKAYSLAALLSRKLTRGLSFVRAATRADVRRILAKIESFVFEMLPGCLKGPLSKLLGGNPFDSKSSLPADVSATSSSSVSSRSLGFGALFEPLLGALQRTLRTRLLELVGGGHRRLEARAWGHVQLAVVGKVGKWVKGVRVEIAEPLDDGRNANVIGTSAQDPSEQDESDQHHRETIGMHHEVGAVGGEAAGFYSSISEQPVSQASQSASYQPPTAQYMPSMPVPDLQEQYHQQTNELSVQPLGPSMPVPQVQRGSQYP